MYTYVYISVPLRWRQELVTKVNTPQGDDQEWRSIGIQFLFPGETFELNFDGLGMLTEIKFIQSKKTKKSPKTLNTNISELYKNVNDYTFSQTVSFTQARLS